MTADVVVVGAGAVGCAISRELSSDYRVRVLERGEVAQEASALGAGLITISASYATMDLRSVARHATEFFNSYDGTAGFDFVHRPSLELVTTDRKDDNSASDEPYPDWPEINQLNVATINEQYPRINTETIVSATEFIDTGFVDTYNFSTALKQDAAAKGAVFETQTAATKIESKGGEISGVKTADGAYDADYVIVAAGWRSEALLRKLYQIPLRPYRTQCVVVEPAVSIDDQVPMGWIPGHRAYFRPTRDGNLLVGGWSLAEDTPHEVSNQADESFQEHVTNIIDTYFINCQKSDVVDHWAGVDGATPDTMPIIDAPDDAPDGLILATGFHGRGIMTAPVAATIVGDLVRETKPSLPTEPFAVNRFESRSRQFRFMSVSAGE